MPDHVGTYRIAYSTIFDRHSGLNGYAGQISFFMSQRPPEERRHCPNETRSEPKSSLHTVTRRSSDDTIAK
jgi:hypothetical protein